MGDGVDLLHCVNRRETAGDQMVRAPKVSILFFAGCLLLLLNSAFLAAFPSATLWYYANVVLHPFLGIALTLFAVPRILSREWLGGPLLTAGVGSVGAGLVLGLIVLVFGATGPYEAVLHAHIVASLGGAALLGVCAWRAVANFEGVRSVVRGSLVAVVLIGAVTPLLRDSLDARWRQSYRIENPTRPPATMEEEGAGLGSPFFPSSANTNTGDIIPANFFLTSEACGRCHTDIYEQWSASTHHFSSFNNQWYRKSIEYMQDVVGTEPSK